jgi:hypothetical protein
MRIDLLRNAKSASENRERVGARQTSVSLPPAFCLPFFFLSID